MEEFRASNSGQRPDNPSRRRLTDRLRRSTNPGDQNQGGRARRAFQRFFTSSARSWNQSSGEGIVPLQPTTEDPSDSQTEEVNASGDQPTTSRRRWTEPLHSITRVFERSSGSRQLQTGELSTSNDQPTQSRRSLTGPLHVITRAFRRASSSDNRRTRDIASSSVEESTNIIQSNEQIEEHSGFSNIKEVVSKGHEDIEKIEELLSKRQSQVEISSDSDKNIDHSNLNDQGYSSTSSTKKVIYEVSKNIEEIEQPLQKKFNEDNMSDSDGNSFTYEEYDPYKVMHNKQEVNSLLEQVKKAEENYKKLLETFKEKLNIKIQEISDLINLNSEISHSELNVNGITFDVIKEFNEKYAIKAKNILCQIVETEAMQRNLEKGAALQQDKTDECNEQRKRLRLLSNVMHQCGDYQKVVDILVERSQNITKVNLSLMHGRKKFRKLIKKCVPYWKSLETLPFRKGFEANQKKTMKRLLTIFPYMI